MRRPVRKKFFQKNMLIIFSLALLFSLFSGSGEVVYGSSDYDYEDFEDGVKITNYKGTNKSIWEIPRLLDGKYVKRIDDQAFKGKELESVYFDLYRISRITSISDEAFRENNLTTVALPSSVTELGKFAFANNLLTDVLYSSNMTKIEEGTFSHNELSHILIPSNIAEIDDEAFAYNPLTQVMIHNVNTTFGTDVFKNNQAPSELTIYGHSGSTAETYATDNDHKFEPILIPDDALRKAINNELGKGESYQPTKEDLESLTEIEYDGWGSNTIKIANLTGLEYAINLKELNLRDNDISDISALENLTNLKVLNLRTNDISDISKLSTLMNLEKLNLDYQFPNKINDISALENLTKLKELTLRNNDISSITALENLTKLKELTLRNNDISSISALANLTKLEVLNLRYNDISDISVLASLTRLKELNIGGDTFFDLSVLEETESLEILDINTSEFDISNFSGLGDLTQLKELVIFGDSVHDLSILRELENLEILDVDGEVRDISGLVDLTNLEELTLGDNDIRDISSLANLTKLKYLNLNENKIHDISPLANLRDLRHLRLSDNYIRDISALSNLTNLGKLDLEYNEIRDISPLKDIYRSIDHLELIQYIKLPEVEVLKNSTTLEIDNPIIGIDGTILDDIDVSEGSYSSPKVKWGELTGIESERTFRFNFENDDRSLEFEGKVTQPIKWVVDERPVIHASDIFILQNENFDPLENVTATNKENDNLTSKIEVMKNEVDTSIPDLYEVEYKVTGHGGQTATKTITVTVISEELNIQLDGRTEVFPGQIGKIEDTGATITFPSDLPLGTFVTITDQGEAVIVTDAEGIERAGDVLDFEFEYPNGQSFTGSFELAMTFGNGLVTEIDIYYYNEATRKWEAQDGTKDASNNLITINPEDFSTYGVFAITEEDPNGDDDPGTEDPNGDNGKDDKDKVVIDDTKDAADKDKDGHEIPKTATNTFNMILIGMILLVLGGTSFFIVRRRAL